MSTPEPSEDQAGLKTESGAVVCAPQDTAPEAPEATQKEAPASLPGALPHPTLKSAAQQLIRRTLSPSGKSKSAREPATPPPAIPALIPAPSARVKTAFGTIKRSGDSVRTIVELATSKSALQEISTAASAAIQADKDTKHGEAPVASAVETHAGTSPSAAPAESGAILIAPQESVDHVRKTLDELVRRLDGVDPKKLRAIRLGGELRGLLGKAQDEFYAYESAFLEHASRDGIAITLQNFAASLEQVFPIVARLQTAKFLLNKNFKAEILFAFQEINSYYTSLFMELSMAVASQAGAVLPLPSSPPSSPLKTQPPLSPVQQEDAPKEVSSEEITLQAHQHYFGHKTPQNRPKAFALYKQAAEMGNTDAMACVGQMYLSGTGIERDALLAEQWLQQAACSGCVDACHSLGCLLIEKAQLHQNELKKRELFAQAMVQFTLAAESGHRNAQHQLGMMYEHGQVGHADELQAAVWYLKAADQDHTPAEVSLGCLFYQGTQTERDVTRATHFFQRAAAKNDANAQTYLARIYTNGNGIKPNVDRAIALYRSASDAGHCEAMFQLAKLLLASTSEQSLERFNDREDLHDEALRLLLNAAHGGVFDAFFTLGELLENSKYLKDKAAALRFYSKAAVAPIRHPKAAKRVAAMHYAGIGTKADKWKAHEFYEIAADAGDAEALNALGLMYEEGEGCDMDFKKAAACYRKAVEMENPHAHFNLGCLLSHGKGVERNPVAAQAHFQKAVELGYTLANDFIHQSG